MAFFGYFRNLLYVRRTDSAVPRTLLAVSAVTTQLRGGGGFAYTSYQVHQVGNLISSSREQLIAIVTTGTTSRVARFALSVPYLGRAIIYLSIYQLLQHSVCTECRSVPSLYLARNASEPRQVRSPLTYYYSSIYNTSTRMVLAPTMEP